MILGDKGDGSPRARAAAKQRFAWANDGHVTDIIHKHAANNGNHVCYESKVYTPAKKSVNLGGGTHDGGGKPSTAAGNLVAFGCMEELLLYEIVGARERGRQADGPFDHSTGTGWVKAHDGYYCDALHVKKNTVVALIAETFGGVTPTVVALLRRLDKMKNATGTDGTAYTGRALDARVLRPSRGCCGSSTALGAGLTGMVWGLVWDTTFDCFGLCA